MKRLTVGILAHVDAGKTTLSEGLLFSSGNIMHLGRVDKRDAFLDTHSLERERGITIFSKQATLEWGDTHITLIDTPGHIDFSCEAERALSVQDYAILVISATDGVTAHTKTLWHLLSAKGIPTFIFVNKLDIADRTRAQLLDELRCNLSSRVVDFSNDTSFEFYEACASQDVRLMDEFFLNESISVDNITASVAKKRIYPCFFGSALKMKGVEELLLGLDKYSMEKQYSDSLFGAKIYKISRDPQGKRLTYLKVTGGSLKTKDSIEITLPSGESVTEKIEEIRLYSGDKYKSASAVSAGSVCAVLGPTSTRVGMGIGFEPSETQTLSPVLDYRIILPKDANPYETYMRIMALSEEDPSLAMNYESATHEIRVRLMGEIQIEVLRRVIADRFGIEVDFDEGEILYKETVADSVYGAGHFEPLRHYAEVHLRIDPMPEGSGIISATECETDTLSLNWQRLIITHIEERVHRGVLIGAPLTDVKITLTAGKAHLKHTEGGDFRQATYRAVRQGLMKSDAVLLEPTFDFRIELPRDNLGRLMNDITSMHGTAMPPEINEHTAILEGNCPVATMRSYASELRAYTRGEGRIALTVGPYMPCHNTDEVMAQRGYSPELDERNPAGSVFCKGGSGYAVPWDEADELMHITPTGVSKEIAEQTVSVRVPKKLDYRGTVEEDKELMRIFESTYGKIKKRTVSERRENSAPTAEKRERPKKLKPKGEEYVIIDGYNFLFAIDELRRAAESDIARARDVLTRLMCDYAAFRKCRVIIAFDAYKRRGGEGSVEHIGPVTVIYTKESQTADAYIERTTYDLADEHSVRVVTSDYQEQLIILGNGGLRVSAREFYAEILDTLKLIREKIESYMK
ncbi:MAG: TetM/TetW/TetO/TetS family tetracycline resistance ribosomal protection protein [Clostridia bacterium]|nr:TetM/TetW/TetO/TetS family tetracycline resistance ribosomal protection protein [Clostridia bacterium]